MSCLFCNNETDEISIHALLAESDAAGCAGCAADIFLSTLSLRRATAAAIAAGVLLYQFLSTLSLRRATAKLAWEGKGELFLSTLSLRRATCIKFFLCAVHSAYFYPRSPCGERLPHQQGIKGRQHISIHALLAESDHIAVKCRHGQILISIHALLAESDESNVVDPFVELNISIHALLAESDLRA